MKIVAWFKELSRKDVAIAGGKGANLGEMMNNGVPVPDGFVVTSEAYADFIEKSGLSSKIAKTLLDLNVEDSAKLKSVSKMIKKEVIESKMPDETAKAILYSYKKLCDANGGKEVYVAVRSSATAEDLPEASFAGQQATFLNVKGEDALLKAVKGCWASLFEARSIYYRVQKGFDHNLVKIAVPVQLMVQSEKSGILFTVNPITNEFNQMSIEAAFGLGETVVSGSVTPDRYLVNKTTFEIENKSIAKQEWMLAKVNEKDQKVNLPEEKQKLQKLSDAEIVALAKLGKNIENHYNFPQDIEWAIENNKIYIVQSRPITTFKKKVPDKTIKASEAKQIIRGLGASPGLAVGFVKIIPSPDHISKLNPSEILVAKMTTPDYVPAMKRAAAIVTDEGGTTCFTGETKLLTNLGFKTMLEVNKLVNEGKKIKVLSVDEKTLKSEWKPVIRAFKRKGEVWSISISQRGSTRQNKINITYDHKMLTFIDRKLQERKLYELLKLEEAVCAVDHIPKPEMSVNEGNLAYLVGALFTDGYFQSNNRRGRVIFTQKRTPEKLEFINAVKANFEEFFGYGFTSERDKISSGLLSRTGETIVGTATDYICSKKEPADLLLWLDKNLCYWISTLDNDSLLNFLAGVVDGDGSFDVNVGKRINIYAGDENLVQAIVIACMRLGISPQISVQRGTCYNIQILEKIDEIFQRCHRIKGKSKTKELGTKLFAAKQILGDIIEKANYKGRIKPYVDGNHLIDSNKVEKYILPMLDDTEKKELNTIIHSDLRMLRACKDAEIGENDVYNIEVEKNHNYVVFTSMYTPLLVRNCHAAIVSRELGIPCVVGTKEGTSKLSDGQMVTVDADHGIIYEGRVELGETMEKQKAEPTVAPISKTVTGTKIYVNLGQPELAVPISKKSADGVGLLRAEFMMAGIGIHPRKIVEEGRQTEYVEKLAENLRTVCAAFYPRPVVYRFTDFKSNEYKNLEGGVQYEMNEANPMMGYRGCARYIAEPDIFKMEIDAIKKTREEAGMKNLHVMIPMVRTEEEVKQCTEMMSKFGLDPKQKDFQVWVMAEVPSVVYLLHEYVKYGIKGVSIGSNDLTQFTLALDRDSPTIAWEFDERNPAVMESIRQIIAKCRELNITCSICGQAPSVYPEVTEKLVEWGITSISVNPDMVEKARDMVASTEQKLILRKLSELQSKL